MLKLREEQITEIADQLDCGFCCYVNRDRSEFLFIPDLNRYPDMELDAWKEERRKIRKNRSRYITIEPPESFESFRFMEDFVETLPDTQPVKRALAKALSKRHPFRNFMATLHDSGEFRQKWFDYKNERLREWVSDRLSLLNDEEE